MKKKEKFTYFEEILTLKLTEKFKNTLPDAKIIYRFNGVAPK